jgi:hypothetical protein
LKARQQNWNKHSIKANDFGVFASQMGGQCKLPTMDHGTPASPQLGQWPLAEQQPKVSIPRQQHVRQVPPGKRREIRRQLPILAYICLRGSFGEPSAIC